TPVTTIEALAAGCPVVATRVGGVPDVVEDGVDGFLTDPRDADALAERLERLAARPPPRAPLGPAGRQRGPAPDAVPPPVDDGAELYRAVLSGGAAGTR